MHHFSCTLPSLPRLGPRPALSAEGQSASEGFPPKTSVTQELKHGGDGGTVQSAKRRCIGLLAGLPAPVIPTTKPIERGCKVYEIGRLAS